MGERGVEGGDANRVSCAEGVPGEVRMGGYAVAEACEQSGVGRAV